MTTDSEIIATSMDCPEAFGELYDRHARAIHRYVARRAGVQTADDVMAETFLVAFGARGRYDRDRDDARPWLYGIATTLLKKHARIEARGYRASAVAAAALTRAVTDLAESADDRLEAQAAMARITGELARMHRRDRDVLLLYAWADLDYQGIAEALGIPVGTVRSRLNRARTRLRGVLDEDEQKEENHGRPETAPARA